MLYNIFMFGLKRKQPERKYRGSPVIQKPLVKTSPNLRNKRMVNQTKLPAINIKKFGLGLVAFLIIVSVLYLFTFFATDQQFAVSDFVFIGNNQLDDSKLEASLSEIRGTNIFLLRTTDVAGKLIRENFFVKSVWIRKYYPNKLLINVTEREPSLTYINLAGVYIVDSDGNVLKQLFNEKLNFTQEGLDIINGFGDPNAAYVRERIMSNLSITPTPTPSNTLLIKPDSSPTPTPTPADFFEDIPISEKIKVLNEIKDELIETVNDTLDKNSTNVSQTEFAGLPRVFVYENNEYSENDIIDKNRLEVTNEANRFLKSSTEFIVERIIWQGRYLVVFKLTTGEEITFGTNRKASEQLEDMLIIQNQLRLEGKTFLKLDLSSKKVAVTVK